MKLPTALCQLFARSPAKPATLGCLIKNPTEDEKPTEIIYDSCQLIDPRNNVINQTPVKYPQCASKFVTFFSIIVTLCVTSNRNLYLNNIVIMMV